jgi:hypothetical protein
MSSTVVAASGLRGRMARFIWIEVEQLCLLGARRAIINNSLPANGIAPSLPTASRPRPVASDTSVR